VNIPLKSLTVSAYIELTVSIPILWIKLYAKHNHVFTNNCLLDIHLHFSFISLPVENAKADYIGKYDVDFFLQVRHPRCVENAKI